MGQNLEILTKQRFDKALGSLTTEELWQWFSTWADTGDFFDQIDGWDNEQLKNAIEEFKQIIAKRQTKKIC